MPAYSKKSQKVPAPQPHVVPQDSPSRALCAALPTDFYRIPVHEFQVMINLVESNPYKRKVVYHLGFCSFI